MKELRSRPTNERPGRPCQFAALSERRAARVGPRRRPSGPERAGAKGSGETLSAGRAAAPSTRVNADGRVRSAARVAHGGTSAQRAKPSELVGRHEARACERAGASFQAMARAVLLTVAAALLFVGASASAAQFAGPSGNIVIQVTNDSESAIPLQNVIVNFSAGPSFLHVPASQGPVATIAVGAVATFTFPYTIDSGALDGVYSATFTVVPQGTPDSESPDGSFDTVVSFATLSPSAIVERVV